MLDEVVRPRVTAATLMSHPVRTITPQTTIQDAARLMLRYGHSGLMVVDDGVVVGIISRRDVDRAIHHELGHAPVRGYMSRKVAAITPETPLPEIERAHDRAQRGPPAGARRRAASSASSPAATCCARCTASAMARCTPSIAGPARRAISIRSMRSACRRKSARCSRASPRSPTTQGVTIFLVGGAVRDLLLGNENIDLDILVEGEGIPLARTRGHRPGGHVDGA